nr:hypothetical protein [Sulfuriferula plumbiphila]
MKIADRDPQRVTDIFCLQFKELTQQKYLGLPWGQIAQAVLKYLPELFFPQRGFRVPPLRRTFIQPPISLAIKECREVFLRRCFPNLASDANLPVLLPQTICNLVCGS